MRSTTKKINNIDYNNINLIKSFITPQGKIMPRYETGLTIQQQKKLAKIIKNGRILALFPFIDSNFIC